MIEDEEARRIKYEEILKDRIDKNLLLNAYMALAKKNQQQNYKKYTRFLKIFPQYFSNNKADFYDDLKLKKLKKIC